MTKRDKKWGESWSNNQYLKRFLNRIQGYISDLLMYNLFIFYRLISERVALSILCQILLSSQWNVVYELQLHMYVIVVVTMFKLLVNHLVNCMQIMFRYMYIHVYSPVVKVKNTKKSRILDACRNITMVIRNNASMIVVSILWRIQLSLLHSRHRDRIIFFRRLWMSTYFKNIYHMYHTGEWTHMGLVSSGISSKTQYMY